MAEEENDAGNQPEVAEGGGPGDFLMGVALALTAAYFFVTGWFVPRPEGWLTAPAMLPLLLSGSLLVMAVLITLETVRNGALRGWSHWPDGANAARPLWRIAFAVVAVAVYYFGLLQFLYFEVATAVYLFVMMRAYWPEGGLRARLAIAIIVPFLVSGSFQGGFGIPLPGDSNVMQDVLYWLRHRGT